VPAPRHRAQAGSRWRLAIGRIGHLKTIEPARHRPGREVCHSRRASEPRLGQQHHALHEQVEQRAEDASTSLLKIGEQFGLGDPISYRRKWQHDRAVLKIAAHDKVGDAIEYDRARGIEERLIRVLV
jgi:hypothetical protein